MNVAFCSSLVAAVVGAAVALLSLGFGSAAGWRQYRTFALVAASASLYCAIDSCFTVAISDRTAVPLQSVQGVVGVLHVAAWHLYVRDQLGALPVRLHRAVMVLLGLVAALWMVPGVLVDGSVSSLSLPWLGVTYHMPMTTGLGGAACGVEVALLGIPVVRYVQAWRAGVRDAALHIAAIGAIFATALHDTLVAGGVFRSPLLVSLGYLASIGAVGWLLTRAFVQSTRELDRLSRRLEHDVEARTHDLVSAEAALLRSEKMAALGQLAAGVAHEINNPAAVVAANIAYLRDDLARGTTPRDALECLDESLEAVDRIAKIVRQLLDSGRAAATGCVEDGAVSSALRAAQKAVTLARPSVPAHVTLSIDIAAGLFVRAHEASLVQVLVNLIVNGAQAVPSHRSAGRVEIRATKDDENLTMEVIDDGSGMTDATKRRLFEPFFTTKPFGQGTGLGLPVSLGLVRSMGGDIQVRSGPRGTTMSVVLYLSESAPSSQTFLATAPARSRSLLLVDDDAAVGKAIARSLHAMFDVELVSDIGGALEKLYERSFDVILSDMQMPDGGGRKLYERLSAESPQTARRMILFSGGAASEADCLFLETHGIALLEKPLALDELLRVSNRICGEQPYPTQGAAR